LVSAFLSHRDGGSVNLFFLELMSTIASWRLRGVGSSGYAGRAN
jgi:hypothetical protein